MSKYRTLAFFVTVLTAMAAFALECTPGALKSLISNPESQTSLAITGSIDASDLQFIATEMPTLRTLDLSGATIERRRDPKTVYPEATIPAMLFAGTSISTLQLPEQEGLVIEDAAFAGAALQELTIPATVKRIGVGAFSSCPALKSVTLNASTTFGSDVFNGCTALTTADLAGAKELPEATFSACTSLTTVTGTDALTEIGPRAFAGSSSLRDFAFPATLQKVGNEAFTHSDIAAADLSGCKKLTAIGERAFAECGALTSAALPETVTELGMGVFAMDAALAQLTLTTAELPDYAFTSSSALATDAVLHEGVQSVGAYALKGHDQAQAITLPAGLAYLGDHAMEGMTGLKEIDASALTSVPELGEDVWAGVDQPEVEMQVARGMGAPFMSAAQWQDFSIKVPSSIADVTASATQAVKARFQGSLLEILSAGADIAKVDVYTVAGKLLTSLSPAAERVEINTEPWSENIYIVSVVLADGTKATAKLLRIL